MVIVEGLISFVFVIRSCSKSTVDRFVLEVKRFYVLSKYVYVTGKVQVPAKSEYLDYAEGRRQNGSTWTLPMSTAKVRVLGLCRDDLIGLGKVRVYFALTETFVLKLK